MKIGKFSLVLLVVVALIIGVSVLAQDQEPLTGTITYTVQPGDVPDLIAAQYDVDLACLLALNDLPANVMLFPGDTLQISADCPHYFGASSVTATRDIQDAPGTYTVQPGDTLETIGKALDVSVVSLQIANGLPVAYTLYQGDVLTVPENAPAYGIFPGLNMLGSGQGETYVIQPGDTLDAVGRAFDASVVALQVANNLFDGYTLRPGDVLTIPADAPPYGVFPPLNALGDGQGDTYVVQPGDTLESIGQALDVSVVSLRIANNLLDSFTLRPGDVLTIPTNAPAFGVYPALNVAAEGEGALYIFQPGDVLDLIAAYFDLDVQCLVERNSITYPIYPGFVMRLFTDCPAYRGLSTPRPEQIRGLGLSVPSATSIPTQAPTRAATATSVPPTAAATQPPTLAPTATLGGATITPTPIPPTATSGGPTPTNTITPGGPTVRPPTITPTIAG